jgi:hypothetical protein
MKSTYSFFAFHIFYANSLFVLFSFDNFCDEQYQACNPDRGRNGKKDEEHRKMEDHGAEDQVPATSTTEEPRREIVAKEVAVGCHPIYGEGDGPELTGFFSSGHSCDYIDASASHGARCHLPSFYASIVASLTPIGCTTLKAVVQPTRHCVNNKG